MNYYNDNDSFSVKWLKALIKNGLIPDGDVDDRSILDVEPKELEKYTQCHFFAGIGGWSRALELAAWPSDRPVWTGSCPCQPLSVAGQGEGEKDERHLWPAFYHLIRECRPVCVFGEQVASKLGREWLAGVHADLEVLEYRFGAADLCAAGVGAPHIRQRLWWVADSDRKGLQKRESNGRIQQKKMEPSKRETFISGFWSNSALIPCADGKFRRVPGRVAYTESQRNVREAGATRQEERRQVGELHRECVGAGAACRQKHQPERVPGRVADAELSKSTRNRQERGKSTSQQKPKRAGTSCNYWSNSTLIPCADGKFRRVPGRVGNTTGTRCQTRGDIGKREEQRSSQPENTGAYDNEQHQPEIEHGKWRRVPGRVAESMQQRTMRQCEDREIPQNRKTIQPNGLQPTTRTNVRGNSNSNINRQNQLEAESPVFAMVARLRDRMGDSWDDGILEALGAFPLSGNVPGRVGLLRGAGNAIVPAVAAEFIKAFTQTQTKEA